VGVCADESLGKESRKGQKGERKICKKLQAPLSPSVTKATVSTSTVHRQQSGVCVSDLQNVRHLCQCVVTEEMQQSVILLVVCVAEWQLRSFQFGILSCAVLLVLRERTQYSSVLKKQTSKRRLECNAVLWHYS